MLGMCASYCRRTNSFSKYELMNDKTIEPVFLNFPHYLMI